MSSRSVLAFAAALLLAGAASAQTTPPDPQSTDAGTPAHAASSATTSMNRGSGTTSDDAGVTNLGAEAARGRTASGAVVLPAAEQKELDACRAMPADAQIHSSRCKHLAAKHPTLFNSDGTAKAANQ